MKIFNFLLQVLFISALFVFVSCEPDTAENADETEMHTEGEEPAGEARNAANDSIPAIIHPPVFENPQINIAYEHYGQLRNALVEEHPDVAQGMAQVITDMLRDVQNSENVRRAAQRITLTADLEKQRTLFMDLSNEMEKLVKSNKMLDGGVYKAYCPMANNGSGASWLTNEKAIRNPYYGNKMLECGEITEVIK